MSIVRIVERGDCTCSNFNPFKIDFKFQTENDLKTVNTIDSLNQKLVSCLKGAVPFPEKELSAAADSFYKKLKSADEYEPKCKINCEVTLLKAKDNFVSMDDDYGLKEVITY